MNELSVVEHDGIRVLTTQQIAEAYGTSGKVISNNFNNNRERYVEGKHFICLTGDALREFKGKSLNLGIAENANKVYLWTEKGAFLHAKSLNTDTAWEVYDRLVDSYFAKRSPDRAALSPELQMFGQLFDAMAKSEIEQRRIAEQTQRLEQRVDTMQSIMTEPIGDWRTEINRKVREISVKVNTPYQALYDQMYSELESTAHCSLKRLQDNKRERMEKAGNTKTAIKNDTTKIAIIEDKPQLKAIFEGIVKRYAMSCA